MSNSEPQEMFHLGVCTRCGNGALGLRTCGGCQEIVVVCDECDLAWTDNQTDAPPATTGTHTLPCPHCEVSLYDAPSHWATMDEIVENQWLAHARDNNLLDLNRGEAFEPRANDRGV